MDSHVSLCVPKPHKAYSRSIVLGIVKVKKKILAPLYLAYASRRDNYVECSIRVYSRTLPIMLVLCLMLSATYYAQNYGGIIDWSLL